MEISTEPLIDEKDLRRLNPKLSDDPALVFVCQPGRDELEDSLLQAIATGLSFSSRTSSLYFAMKWNRIEYARRYILNYQTIIHWTVRCVDLLSRKEKHHR